MTAGHPELIAAISSEIAMSGPIPFVRFMELALYHPQFGYYMRPPDAERNASAGQAISTPAPMCIRFSAMRLRTSRQIDAMLGHPDPFTIVEMGPGKGLLARDFLTAMLRDRTHHHTSSLCPDRTQPCHARTAADRSEPLARAVWPRHLGGRSREPRPASVEGLFFSNELLDAFPVHRIHDRRADAGTLCGL